MQPPHLTAADLAEAARSGTLDAGARLHIETCSRCRLRYESAKWSYTSIGGTLQRSIGRQRFIKPGFEDSAMPSARVPHVLRAKAGAPGAAEEHLSDDRLLALATAAASGENVRSWERHLKNCETCARRAAQLRRFSARGEPVLDLNEARAFATLPETPRPIQRAKLSVRPMPGQRVLSLTLWTEGEAPQEACTEIVLPGATPLVHLSASSQGGETRLDLMIDAHGVPAPNVAIVLQSPSRRMAQAVTGRDGRATVPLESGASHLFIAIQPAWEIEIDL